MTVKVGKVGRQIAWVHDCMITGGVPMQSNSKFEFERPSHTLLSYLLLAVISRRREIEKSDSGKSTGFAGMLALTIRRWTSLTS